MKHSDNWCGRWLRLTVTATATVAALVTAPGTGTAAAPITQPEATPVPPFATGTWTDTQGRGLATADLKAAATCVTSSNNPRLHGNPRKVMGASHTACSERTASIKTRVELYRYEGGWKLVALDVAEVRGVPAAGARVDKPCVNARLGHFWVRGVHRVIFKNGYSATATSGSRVKRLSCDL